MFSGVGHGQGNAASPVTSDEHSTCAGRDERIDEGRHDVCRPPTHQVVFAARPQWHAWRTTAAGHVDGDDAEARMDQGRDEPATPAARGIRRVAVKQHGERRRVCAGEVEIGNIHIQSVGSVGFGFCFALPHFERRTAPAAGASDRIAGDCTGPWKSLRGPRGCTSTRRSARFWWRGWVAGRNRNLFLLRGPPVHTHSILDRSAAERERECGARFDGMRERGGEGGQ
mmetsp:Transcript_6614/g.11672  ORF Transcript_6614/g.11672 Transcript_6614/m.11672 type:complete len:227 (-) Transcript_6614:655-1335(-)